MASATVSGVVLSADATQRTLYIVDAHAHVYLVLGTRVFRVGSRVAVRGRFLPDGWTIVATERGDRIVPTGSASRVSVRGELGFVDLERRTFQLGAHGQLVADVRFPRTLGRSLVRMNAYTPTRTRIFALRIARGSIELLALPR